jgi:hypothetical protein
MIGPVAGWWDAYVEAREEPDTINWNEFKMAFHHQLEAHEEPDSITYLNALSSLRIKSFRI